MLVLSRKRDEKVIFDMTVERVRAFAKAGRGIHVELMVAAILGDKVRLGIDAPADMAVHRDEVWAAIQQEER